jgi:hypothetical protein
VDDADWLDLARFTSTPLGGDNRKTLCDAWANGSALWRSSMQGEMMLRRLALATLAAGLAMTGTLAHSGAAGAATPTSVKPKPGGVWTFQVVNGSCEVQTFAAGGVWTADNFGDSGTYVDGVSRGHKTVALTWTAGGDAGLMWTGTWYKAHHHYSGPEGGTGSSTATLTHGATSGC